VCSHEAARKGGFFIAQKPFVWHARKRSHSLKVRGSLDKVKLQSLTASFFCVAVTAFGQGSVNFNNRVASGLPGRVVAPIFDVDPNCPDYPKQGNPATYAVDPVPVGTQTYGGAPLVGTGFTVALWGVNANLPDSVLADPAAAPISVATFRVTTNPALMGFIQPPAVAPIVPGVLSGSSDRAKFIVRAWDNRGGTITSWAQVLQAPDLTVHGESSIFVVDAPLAGPGMTPPNLVGWESFQLYTAGGFCVPEPAALVLTVAAGSALLLLRRQRGSSKNR